MSLINVFITIDTEHSIGGAFRNPSLKPVGNDKRVYGRFNGKEYGIPMIMDIADRYGIPLTFFVEVLNKYYFGEAETREVCEYILKRGHDVQLHLHPTFLNFKQDIPSASKFSDNMSAYNLDMQIQLVGEGKELLKRYCGRVPVAFRAGNYGSDISTLAALEANGMKIDSSYNATLPNHSRRITETKLNDAVKINGVWELPITNFIETIPLFKKRFKPLDLNGVSFSEIKTVLKQSGEGKGPKHITLILHSFSFLKSEDVQYHNCGIRQYVIRRFEKMCRYLEENNSKINCQTLTHWATTGSINQESKDDHNFPNMPSILSILRAVEQKFFEASSRYD